MQSSQSLLTTRLSRLILILTALLAAAMFVLNIKFLSDSWHKELFITRISGSGSVGLLKANAQGYGMYLVFSEYYQGMSLISTKGYWDKSFSVPTKFLTSWGGLKDVIIKNYDTAITEQQAEAFKDFNAFSLTLYNNTDRMVPVLFVQPLPKSHTIIALNSPTGVIVAPLEIAQRIVPSLR